MKLRRVYPLLSSGPVHQVAFACALPDPKSGILVAEFEVSGPSPRVNRELPGDRSVWGLWDWDVVELFVAANPQSSSYLEVQLSPLGQWVEILIHEPRRRWDAEFRSGFRGSVTPYDGKRWQARLEVPLFALGWDGDQRSVRGNAFAILGDEPAREHFSRFLPEQARPDFHLPEYFNVLLS